MSSAKYLLVPLGAGIPAALVLGIYALFGPGLGGFAQPESPPRASAAQPEPSAERAETRPQPPADRPVQVALSGETGPASQSATEQAVPAVQVAQAQSQLPGASPQRPQAPPPTSPAAPAGAPAPAATPATGSLPVPAGRQAVQIDRNNIVFLVRSTLLALHHANETGNYSVLREMSAPGFQSANNPARLTEIFEPARPKTGSSTRIYLRAAAHVAAER